MADNFKMVDLARSKESLSPKTVGQVKPSPYSYEHRITLDQDHMDKLGMDMPKVGDKFHVLGHGEVVSVNSDHSEGGKKSTRAQIQLKRMAVKPGTGTIDSLFGAVNKGISDADAEG